MAELKLDNRVVAAAKRSARYAARMGHEVTACPYRGDEPEAAALRRLWIAEYLRRRPPAAGTVSYDG